MILTSRHLAAELWSRVQQLQDQIQVELRGFPADSTGRFRGFCPPLVTSKQERHCNWAINHGGIFYRFFFGIRGYNLSWECVIHATTNGEFATRPSDFTAFEQEKGGLNMIKPATNHGDYGINQPKVLFVSNSEMIQPAKFEISALARQGSRAQWGALSPGKLGSFGEAGLSIHGIYGIYGNIWRFNDG